MITQAQIPAVLDHPVYDSGGNKIGSAKHVFYDDATGNPEWVTVKTGMFGSSESFIPTHDASLVQDHLEVPYGKDQIKDAPNVDIDAGGHLSEQEEHRLYKYYGLDGGLDDRQGGKHAKTGGGPDAKGGMAAMGGAGAVGAAGAAGTANRRDSAAEAGSAGTAAMAPGDASALDLDKEAMGRDTASRGPTSTARADERAEDIAMTRSEEHMTVGTERHESARARLHKYVVTEEEQQTIPVRHEEVRVVREPITAENRDAAMRGADISEADHEVTLHEERPVVEMHTEPVERVRLTTEEKVEQQTVSGTVRKERIEAETEAPDGTKGHVSGQDRGGRGGMPRS
ncbi:PRC and DUF2382 domain-containing protein [Streptomyces sp. NRRL F-5126]|uniref:PRC and DUF2382 domain-containing protein n=1 Tax=Streptomyces sp. NRRL F-5126 TaxID=1463857 RepID=UPI0004C47C4E|nr:PRC and DUF2382 domain-containing protein [Streptomyces sp. NRRL F-5126]